jgi:hypothetical protein
MWHSLSDDKLKALPVSFMYRCYQQLYINPRNRVLRKCLAISDVIGHTHSVMASTSRASASSGCTQMYIYLPA